MKPRGKWCLLGIPDHEAVLPVGGRLGAQLGPAAFRRVFARLSGRSGVHEACLDLGDAGPMGLKVPENHQVATRIIQTKCQAFALSVIVGGSHDHGFSQIKGLERKGTRLGCINIDAHLDVRKPEPLITSGSPFYLALENGVLDPKRFIEFGIQSHCNAKPLWEYIEKKRVSVIPIESLRGGKAPGAFRGALAGLTKSCDEIIVSFDLDSIAEAHAPGVSAPQAEGLSASEAIEIAEIAGKNKKVRSLGIFELNPEHDIDDRTARLAATIAYHFVATRLG